MVRENPWGVWVRRGGTECCNNGARTTGTFVFEGVVQDTFWVFFYDPLEEVMVIVKAHPLMGAIFALSGGIPVVQAVMSQVGGAYKYGL